MRPSFGPAAHRRNGRRVGVGDGVMKPKILEVFVWDMDRLRACVLLTDGNNAWTGDMEIDDLWNLCGTAEETRSQFIEDIRGQAAYLIDGGEARRTSVIV